MMIQTTAHIPRYVTIINRLYMSTVFRRKLADHRCREAHITHWYKAGYKLDKYLSLVPTYSAAVHITMHCTAQCQSNIYIAPIIEGRI